MPTMRYAVVKRKAKRLAGAVIRRELGRLRGERPWTNRIPWGPHCKAVVERVPELAHTDTGRVGA